MSIDHLILGGMLGAMLRIQILVSPSFMTKNATDARERMEALMHGQEHIAELVAEVLRRTQSAKTSAPTDSRIHSLWKWCICSIRSSWA